MDYVQSATAGGVLSPVVSTAFASSSGNTIVLTLAHDLAPSTVVSVTDSYGNAYSRLLAATSGGPWPTTLNVFYATNITGGAGHTITATFPPTRPEGQDHCRFIAQEFTGFGVPERVSTQTGNTAAISSGPTASANQPNEFVIGSVAVDSLSSTDMTEGEGWGNRLIGTGRYCMLGQCSRIAETADPQTSTWTLNEPRDWAAGVVTFAVPTPAAGFTRVQAASNGGVATSLSVTLPKAPTPGNLLVCWWVSGSACTLTNSGWTAGPRVDANVGSAMYYKIATSSDAASVAFTLSRNNVAAGFVEYAGNSAAPFDRQGTSSVFNDTGALSITAISVPTTEANDLVVSLAALHASVTAGYPASPTWTAGLSNALAQGDGQSSASNVTCYSFYGDNLDAGAAGTRSVQANWSATQFKQRTGLAMAFKVGAAPRTINRGAFFAFL